MKYLIRDLPVNETFEFDTFEDSDDLPYMQLMDRFDEGMHSYGLLALVESATDALVERWPDIDDHLAPLGMKLAGPIHKED